MIVTTLVAATVAAAEPQVASQGPAQPHANHNAGQAEKKMACCDKMAKGEGCDCCKDMGKKDATPAHGEHGDQDH